MVYGLGHDRNYPYFVFLCVTVGTSSGDKSTHLPFAYYTVVLAYTIRDLVVSR